MIRRRYERSPAEAGYGGRQLQTPLSRGSQYSAHPLSYSPSTFRCLVHGDVSSSVPHIHCLSSARYVLNAGCHSKRYPHSAYPQVHTATGIQTYAIHLMRHVNARFAYSGASDGIYVRHAETSSWRYEGLDSPCQSRCLVLVFQSPHSSSLLRSPYPNRFPGQNFLALGTGHCSQPLRTSTVKTLMLLPRLCSTPWRDAAHLPTCTRRLRTQMASVHTRWQRFYFFSSPSIGYQKPHPQHGLCSYLSLSAMRGSSAVGYGLKLETR